MITLGIRRDANISLEANDQYWSKAYIGCYKETGMVFFYNTHIELCKLKKKATVLKFKQSSIDLNHNVTPYNINNTCT